MSKVFVERIHPTRNPNHCVISGERDGGGLGFWAGPDINVTGQQIVTPHVSRRMAKQWLEDAGLVVDAQQHQAILDELDAKERELDEALRAKAQLEKRLTRIFPGGRKASGTRAVRG